MLPAVAIKGADLIRAKIKRKTEFFYDNSKFKIKNSKLKNHLFRPSIH